MAEYIDREKAYDAVLFATCGTGYQYEATYAIDRIPEADVAPVVHGHWTQVDDTKCRCSNCDIIALIGLYPHGDKNYCPNCGAKMDKNWGDFIE